MMAFISQDDTVSDDQSMFVAPSFMTSANDEDPYSGNGVSKIEIYPSTRRNILDDINNVETTVLPAPSEKESLSVFLRVKPNTEKELEIIRENQKLGSEDSARIERIVSVESDYQLAMHAPKESQTYKNSMNGVGKMCHRYTFTHIFNPDTTQQDIFSNVVKPKVKDFLGGQNQLVFTYGATSAGKTFTIQGIPSNAGIVPRAIDTLFNTVGAQQSSEVPLKPAGFSKVIRVTPTELRQLKKDKEAVFRLGLELQVQQGRRSPAEDLASSQVSVSSQSSQSSQSSVLSSISSRDSLDLSRLEQMFPGLSSRDKETATVDVHDANITYTIWISFAEIYNENIYDLLQKVPVSKQKTEKIRRNPLKLADDRNGSTFVKGLREIQVANADEAYQALMIGRENLHFSATRLNQNSSRSHCIFTIKVVRVADPNEPHLARVSLLSFCDLAGSERISKTHNTGDRQKEAGNINTSLLVLGRCIKAIRHNQTIKDTKKHQVVPYRESKLTRLFKTFFTGLGKASLLVCISQAQYLFDESIHVLKFASIASKVTIEQIKAPLPKPPKKNVSRFSTMVAGAKSFMGPSQSRLDKSSFLRRGTIDWEAPRSSYARSTMIPGQMSVQFGTTIASNGSSGLMDLTEAEEGANEGDDTVLTHGDTSVMDNTVVQTQYDSLLTLVEDLKEKLIEEKKKNLKLEGDLREELCKEFNDMLVEVERDCEQRLAVEKERATELADWRITAYSTAVRKEKKRKRDDDEEFGSEVELVRAQNSLEKKAKELDNVKEQLVDNESVINAMKETVKKTNETQGKLQAENSKLQFELAEQKRIVSEKEKDLEKGKKREEEESKSEEETTALLREELKKKETEINDLNELLQEAGEEFFEKQEEKTELEGNIKEKDEQITQQGIMIQDLEGQLEESHVLLQEANNQLDEKEAKIEELEEGMEAAPSKDRVNELEYKVGLLEESLETEKGRANEAEDCVKQQMEKIKELLEVIEETPNAEEVCELKESLKEEKQRASDAEEVLAEQSKKMEELVDSLEKAPSPKDVKELEKKIEVLGLELGTEKSKVAEITKRMRDKIVELREMEENVEKEAKKATAASKMAEEAKADAKEASRIAELERDAAIEAKRMAEVEKASAKEADEKTYKAQEERSELQNQKSKLLEEIAKLKENKLSVSQEFESDIECDELKGEIENLNRVNNEINKASKALKIENDNLKAELEEIKKSLDTLKQAQIKEKMEVSMNNMFDDSQSESVDLDYRSEELKQIRVENEQLLSSNSSLEKALNKAQEATSILENELVSLKKLQSEATDKNVERDQAIVLKEQDIEELKKQYSSDKSTWENAMKDLKEELEGAITSSELTLSKTQQQLTENEVKKKQLEEELENNKTLVCEYKKKEGDHEKSVEILEEKLKNLECDKKLKRQQSQQEITMRVESEGRTDSLEKDVATKDLYIKELEDIIVEKDFTITEMEEKKGSDETDGASKYSELENKCKKLDKEKITIESQLNNELEKQKESVKELTEQRTNLEAKLEQVKEEKTKIENQLNDELKVSRESNKKLEDERAGLEAKINKSEEELQKKHEVDKDWMEKNKQTREDLEKRVQALSKYSQKSAELFEKEEEIIKLQADVKRCEAKNSELESELEKVNQKVKSMKAELDESCDELKILKRSSKEAAREANVHHDIKMKNAELEKELERLKPLNEARQREEAALDVLREELSSKGREIATLQEKVDFHKAEAEAKDYEVTKAKEDREKLMGHYDGILKQKQLELTTEKDRRSEAAKLQEAIARATPSKKDRESGEIKTLKEQLEKKEEKVEELSTQLLDLQKVMDEKSVAHERESKRLKLANKKVIEEYKEANKQLQKRVPLNPIPLFTKTSPDDKSREADDSKSDASLIEVTPVVKKKTRGRGRGAGASRTNSSMASLASCEDSNNENDPDQSVDNNKLSRKPRVSRAGKKKEVSFTEEPEADRSTSRKRNLRAETSALTEMQCLSPVMESGAVAGEAFMTPAPCSMKKKRKLYTLTPQHNEVFTPEEGDGNHDSPLSTVKKQLSCRRSMRRK